MNADCKTWISTTLIVCQSSGFTSQRRQQRQTHMHTYVHQRTLNINFKISHCRYNKKKTSSHKNTNIIIKMLLTSRKKRHFAITNCSHLFCYLKGLGSGGLYYIYNFKQQHSRLAVKRWHSNKTTMWKK